MTSPIALFRSKMPVIAAICAVLLALAYGWETRGTVQGAWQLLQVPAYESPFADTAVVTLPMDCVNEGKDPYDSNVCHPMNSVYNYPPIWLKLRYLGVNSRSTLLLGIVQVTLFAIALLCLFTAETLVERRCNLLWSSFAAGPPGRRTRQ